MSKGITQTVGAHTEVYLLQRGQQIGGSYSRVYFHRRTVWTLPRPGFTLRKQATQTQLQTSQMSNSVLWHYGKTQTKTHVCLVNLTNTLYCGQLCLARFFFFYCNTEVGTVFQPCKGACLGATLEGDRSWRFHSALWLLFSSFTGISLWDIKHKKNYNRSDPVTHTVVSRHTAGWKMQIRSSAELGKS